MKLDPSSGPPYFDWALDRWKVLVLILLFILLLLLALFWPDDGATVYTLLSRIA